MKSMRTESEMMGTILSLAEKDSRIRVVTLEGSRTNRQIPKDEFQDYDITFFVEDISAFTGCDDWLSAFGSIIMMQKPEDMELFPAEEPGYSYLMLFEDYNKIDLTLLPLETLEDYFLRGDKLREVLLDKDERIRRKVVPTDEEYHIRKPSARSFDDCCNEFWNVTTYVVKGLCRREILFAIDHMNQILRYELLRMLSWQVGIETGFSCSVGKNFKFISQYLSPEIWERLLCTYRMDSYENMWDSLWECHRLFRETARTVADCLGYAIPPYDYVITEYSRDMYRKFSSASE